MALFWHELKQIGVFLLAAVNVALLVWAFRTYRRKGALPDGFYNLLPLSPAIAAMQVVLGISFLAGGQRAQGMHYFYGIIAGVGALAQVALTRRTAWGHRYRAKPLVYGFVSLVIFFAAIRAWMKV